MFEQYKLPYAYDALEPHIDALTVETHHGKHHAAYTAGLNNFAEKAGVQDMDIVELLGNLDKIEDPALRTSIRNQGGGYYNHNLYFETLSPNGGGKPTGALAEKIDSTFGSFEEFKTQINALAAGQFGSGWAWLAADKEGNLFLSKTANQDNPISNGSGTMPILAIDVWEHAYYLKFKNLRAKYIDTLYEVIDWNVVEEKYQAAMK